MQNLSSPSDSKALDELFYSVGTYRKSNELKELFQFIRRFPHIAPYNAFLLHIQRPGCQFVATAEVWRTRFQRTIKPGARPLVILRPFGPVSFVFDLSDTQGDEALPDEILHPFQTSAGMITTEFATLLENLPREGIAYYEADYGSCHAGHIEQADPPRTQLLPTSKIALKVLYTMVINKNLTQTEKFATIVHELGHLYCGHLGVITIDKKPLGWWQARPFIDKQAKEFEAESVAWLVCQRLGLETNSAAYLRSYLAENESIPAISLECVFRVAGFIEGMLKKRLPIRKELRLAQPTPQKLA